MIIPIKMFVRNQVLKVSDDNINNLILDLDIQIQRWQFEKA